MKYEYKNNKLVTDDPNPPEWWKRVVHFVEVEIPAVKWMSGCGEVLPEWKVFETRDAASDALDAAWNAARDAASDASDAWDAWDAAWDATWDAARDAAWNAARDAAWDAAWDAALDAASDAWDASLMAAMHLTSDLDVANEHRAHTAKRWDVWVRGYGLLCDVDGVLYVYKRV